VSRHGRERNRREPMSPDGEATPARASVEPVPVVDHRPPAPAERIPDPVLSDSPRAGTAEPEPLDLPQGFQARPELDWLDETETPEARSTGPDAAQPPAPEPSESSTKSRFPAPALVAGLILAGLGLGYGLFSPTPEPRSAALEIERAASLAPVPAPEAEIGGAEPLPQAQDAPGAVPDYIPPAEASPEPEAAPLVEPSRDMAPPAPATEGAAAPSAQETTPVASAAALASPAPGAVPATPAQAPAQTPSVQAPVPPPTAAGGESLAQIAKLLETHQALIERLERREQVLSDRIEGLEVRAESRREKPVAPTVPKASRLPPTTTSLPVKTLPQRRVVSPKGPPLPFSVESVDTWNGEKTVVVRDGGRLIDLKLGDSHAGWRIEAADGQTVTVRSPQGAAHTVDAGS
jgi:hypothetical protein